MVNTNRRSIVLLALLSMASGALILTAFMKPTAASVCIAFASVAAVFAFIASIQKENR